jgi:hypothetical protein
MKSEKSTTLIKHLKEKKDFKVFFDGEYEDVYKFNKEKNRYQSKYGFITLDAMIRAIEDENYFIKLEII